MLVAWRAEQQGIPVREPVMAGAFGAAERVAALIPQHRRRLPLLNDRCVDLVGRVAS